MRMRYTACHYGQFENLLSVNKTREMRFFGWAHFAPVCFFCGHVCCDHFFIAKEQNMKNTSRTTRIITQAAVIAELNTVLTYAQYLLWPESTSMAIQVRISESMLVLAFFTPAAVPGMTIGCLLFNLTYAGTLPLDWLVGTLATLLAVWGMRMTRNITVKGYPILGMLLPALTNGLLVGWELTYYIGEASFWYNALFVALGEVIALLVVGTVLFYAIKNRKLEKLMKI